MVESEEIFKVAMPEPFKGTEPRLLPPSRKVTGPVGMPKIALTVAVRITVLPAGAGVLDEASVVVLGIPEIWPA